MSNRRYNSVTAFDAYIMINSAWRAEFGEDLPDFARESTAKWGVMEPADADQTAQVFKDISMWMAVKSGKFKRDELAHNNYTFRNLGRVARKAYSDWKKEQPK